MPTPSDLLHAITDDVWSVLDDASALNQQQLTFVRYIEKLATELLQIVQPMPQSAYALQRILPTLGDGFLQQQAALFGYAKLLLEHPQSFDGATLPSRMQAPMQGIYQNGLALHRLTEQILTAASDSRLQAHRAPAEKIDLADLLKQETPILDYFLQKSPVQLMVYHTPIIVYAERYHLIALIQHIVTTLASELEANGQIRLTMQDAAPYGILDIFCEGVYLTSDAQEILFKKQGRYMYVRRLEKAGGRLQILPDIDSGASIQLYLPQTEQFRNKP